VFETMRHFAKCKANRQKHIERMLTSRFCHRLRMGMWGVAIGDVDEARKAMTCELDWQIANGCPVPIGTLRNGTRTHYGRCVATDGSRIWRHQTQPPQVAHNPRCATTSRKAQRCKCCTVTRRSKDAAGCVASNATGGYVQGVSLGGWLETCWIPPAQQLLNNVLLTHDASAVRIPRRLL